MLTERTGAQAVPGADIWGTSRDFPALDGSRQERGWREQEAPCPPPGWLLPRCLGAGGGCSARGRCPLSRIEKVTGNVSPPRGAGTGFSGAFPTEPSRSFDGGPQTQDAGVGDACRGNDLRFHVLHVLVLLVLRVPSLLK